jgi:acyl-CoA reductase-like NAD-dependent aldehyde dehydrogenase
MVQGIVIDDENCIVNVNPATAMVISRVPCTPIDDIPILVQQAREAFLSWSQQASLEERIECLRQGLNTLATREEELISLIIQEMGKPVAEAKEEVTMALSKRGDYLDLVQASLQPQRQPPPHSNTVVVRQALGVVVIISPWNFPVDEILLLALPALASGNVVIVKPSEVTPETGATVVACLSQALPPGVLQLVQGDGTVGAALVSHPDVNLIAMTGSSATGRHIYQTAAVTSTTPPPAMAMAETTTTTVSTTTTPADVTIMDWAQGGTVYQSTSESTATAVMETTTTTTLTSSSSPARVTVPPPPPLKRVVLEMGGKDPMIVFADADLNVAARDAVAYSLANTGQVCCSIERIYVDESIYDDFCKRVTQVATTFSVGNGQDPHVKVGPLVSPIQRDHVDAQVQDALERGATLLYQSDIPENHTNTDVTCTATLTLTTCFYPVTVLGDVTHEMDVFSRETFGPVVALSKFDGSEEQAIQLANQTEYGLASSVYTTDLAKAQRVASAIDAGQVGINCYAIEHMNIHCPWYVLCIYMTILHDQLGSRGCFNLPICRCHVVRFALTKNKKT